MMGDNVQGNSIQTLFEIEKEQERVIEAELQKRL
jgi:hypothetical protein